MESQQVHPKVFSKVAVILAISLLFATRPNLARIAGANPTED